MNDEALAAVRATYDYPAQGDTAEAIIRAYLALADPPPCGSVLASCVYWKELSCELPTGHKRAHRNGGTTWA